MSASLQSCVEVTLLRGTRSTYLTNLSAGDSKRSHLGMIAIIAILDKRKRVITAIIAFLAAVK